MTCEDSPKTPGRDAIEKVFHRLAIAFRRAALPVVGGKNKFNKFTPESQRTMKLTAPVLREIFDGPVRCFHLRKPSTRLTSEARDEAVRQVEKTMHDSRNEGERKVGELGAEAGKQIAFISRAIDELRSSD